MLLRRKYDVHSELGPPTKPQASSRCSKMTLLFAAMPKTFHSYFLKIALRQGFDHVCTTPGGRLTHKLYLQDCMCRAVSPSPTDLPACLLQQALGNLDACQTESRRALERREASRNMRESMLFPSLRRLLRDCGWFGRALFGTEQASGLSPVMSSNSIGSGNYS